MWRKSRPDEGKTMARKIIDDDTSTKDGSLAKVDGSSPSWNLVPVTVYGRRELTNRRDLEDGVIWDEV
jgi:hypothetical protein